MQLGPSWLSIAVVNEEALFAELMLLNVAVLVVVVFNKNAGG